MTCLGNGKMKETVYKNIKYIAVVDGKVQLYKEKDKDQM